MRSSQILFFVDWTGLGEDRLLLCVRECSKSKEGGERDSYPRQRWLVGRRPCPRSGCHGDAFPTRCRLQSRRPALHPGIVSEPEPLRRRRLLGRRLQHKTLLHVKGWFSRSRHRTAREEKVRERRKIKSKKGKEFFAISPSLRLETFP